MTKHIRSLLLLGLLTPGLHIHAQETPVAIIPEPVSAQWHSGSFALDANTVLVANDSDVLSAGFFNDYLQHFYGLHLAVNKTGATHVITLVTRPDVRQGKDGQYHLETTARGITITGSTHAGTFYGIQTLIQLLPLTPLQITPNGPIVKTQNGILKIPAVTIDDYPRFAYRGLHLDVGRHFFSVDFVKRYIDFIALHKMNYFHWHLTEDQGWRIEIKKYPRLTEIGAWRSGTIIGHHPGTGNDSTRHGGFYTQDQIREVVKYAADRYITIIPEIEMPGHASAALAAYPSLGCTGGPYQVQQTWGVFKDVYCAGNDSVFQFLQEVVDEIIPLFPAAYIHIGGDECPKDSWKTCPKCQKRMAALGLKSEDELQSWFVQRMEKYINSKGKSIIGWDEILEGGIAPNATIMSWRGEKGGIQAAKQHHNVIMTPTDYVYFDYSQTHKDDSLTIGGYLPLDHVYGYEPIPKELTGSDTSYILGAQANVWTEYMSNTAKVEYMIFPRLSALSEVLWTPKTSRNYADFQRRLTTQYQRYTLWKD